MKKNGVGLAGMIVGIVAAVTSCAWGAGGVLGIVGMILSIIGLTKKDTKKTQAIIGAILNGLAILVGVIFLIVLTGIIAPQAVKYADKTEVSSDIQMCESIRTAVITAIMDPKVISSDDYYDQDIIKMLSSEGTEFRLDTLDSGYVNSEWGRAVNDIMGFDVFSKSFSKKFKTKEAQNSPIYVKIGNNKVTVYVTEEIKAGY